MPTPLFNQANITYDYPGAASPGEATSNTTTTTLLDAYSLLAAKRGLADTYRPGENLAYAVSAVNNGQGSLYNLTLQDDLGLGSAAGPSPLLYYPDSAQVYVNGELTVATVSATDTSLSIVLSGEFAPGDSAVFVYMTTVREGADAQSITNSARVSANSGSPAGAVVSAQPAPTFTVTAAQFAQLAIYKQADKDTVMSGDSLTYTFTLTNTGNQPAGSVVLTDTLPAGFAISSITVAAEGQTVTYGPGDYTLDADNTLTLPAGEGAPISVAAGDVTTITVTGQVTA
ncbi:MAG: DUF11 domain-containing protein [Christensenellaceae bacterium]|nr:DUF11 domain-containing protein [Christensenellaceae bacterium]